MIKDVVTTDFKPATKHDPLFAQYFESHGGRSNSYQDKDKPLPIGFVGRIFVLSFLLINLAFLNITSVFAYEEEVRFEGYAIEKTNLIGANLWTVKVDKVISGSIISEGCSYVVSITPYEVISATSRIGLGYLDPNINTGDKVECYGKGMSDPLSLSDISLDESRSYYLKKVSTASTGGCWGTISVYVYDSKNNSPLSGAFVSILPSGLSYSTAKGYISVSGQCPGTKTISVSLHGYNSVTESITTDANGDAQVRIALTPTCTYTISGYVYDAITTQPIEGAYIYFTPSGLSTYSGSSGYYCSADQFCARSTQTIICHALNYESTTQSIIIDSYDDDQYNFLLQPTTEPATLPTDLAVRYKYLAEYWSPVIVQYISKDNDPENDPKKDYILKFNFDGDFNAWNNEDSIEKMDLGSVAQCRAYVYYWVVETETHYFVGYGFFHPIDWKEGVLQSQSHENDFEGIFLCIEKDQETFGDWGRLVAMRVIYHDLPQPPYRNTITYQGFNGIHPIIYSESKGHGIYTIEYDEKPNDIATIIGVSSQHGNEF